MAGDKKGEVRKVAQKETGQLKSMYDPQIAQFQGLFNQAAPRQMQDYNQLMGGYQNFAQTGGFSGNDLANIRARSVAPIRAAYSAANRNVNRQKSLQGGYAPGQGVLQARMAREQSSGMSDAAQNTEGMIAQMVQQGKLAGLQGGSSLYGTTPGQSALFGNQVLNAMGQRANVGQMGINAELGTQQLPGKWEGTLGRIGDVAKMGTNLVFPWL